MMTARLGACALAIASLILLWTSAPARADDAVRLEWRSLAEERFDWSRRTEVTSTLEVEENGETSTETAVRTEALDGTIEVLSVDRRGHAELEFRLARFELRQTGPYALTLRASRESDTHTDGQCRLANAELSSGETRAVEDTLRGIAERLVLARFTFTLTPNGVLSEAKVDRNILGAIRSDPLASRVLFRTLGVATSRELTESIRASLAVEIPGVTQTVGDTWESETPLAVGFHVFPVTRRYELTKAGVRSSIQQQIHCEEAGEALIGAYGQAANTHEFVAWVLGASETEEAQVEATVEYSPASGRPVSKHVKGVLYSGTRVLNERRRGGRRDLRLHAAVDQKTTWAPRLGAALPTPPPPPVDPDADSPTADGGPAPADPVELDGTATSADLSWNPAEGTRLRLTREADRHLRWQGKYDSKSLPKLFERSTQSIRAIAEIGAERRDGAGRWVRLTLQSVTIGLREPGLNTDIALSVDGEGEVVCKVTLRGELWKELQSLSGAEFEPEMEAATKGLYARFLGRPVRFALLPDGSIVDVEFDGKPPSVPARLRRPLRLMGLDSMIDHPEREAENLIEELFLPVPGGPTEVGNTWSRSVRDTALEGEIDIKRNAVFASRAKKAMIRDEFEATGIESEVERSVRAELKALQSWSFRVHLGTPESRGKLLTGMSIFDPARRIGELRRVKGRVADVKVPFDVVSAYGNASGYLRCMLDLSEEVRCEVIE